MGVGVDQTGEDDAAPGVDDLTRPVEGKRGRHRLDPSSPDAHIERAIEPL